MYMYMYMYMYTYMYMYMYTYIYCENRVLLTISQSMQYNLLHNMGKSTWVDLQNQLNYFSHSTL